MKDETYEIVIEALTEKIERLQRKLATSNAIKESYKRDLDDAIERLKELEDDYK